MIYVFSVDVFSLKSSTNCVTWVMLFQFHTNCYAKANNSHYPNIILSMHHYIIEVIFDQWAHHNHMKGKRQTDLNP